MHREPAHRVPIPDIVPDRVLPSLQRWRMPDGTVITPRQVEVLWLLSHGLTKAEAAERLVLSEDTVRSHATNVYRRLGARSMAHAVRLGLELGLIR